MLWGVNAQGAAIAEGANDSGAGVGFKKIAHWNKGGKGKTAQLSHDECSAQERLREWRGESWVPLCRLQLQKSPERRTHWDTAMTHGLVESLSLISYQQSAAWLHRLWRCAAVSPRNCSAARQLPQGPRRRWSRCKSVLWSRQPANSPVLSPRARENTRPELASATVAVIPSSRCSSHPRLRPHIHHGFPNRRRDSSVYLRRLRFPGHLAALRRLFLRVGQPDV